MLFQSLDSFFQKRIRQTLLRSRSRQRRNRHEKKEKYCDQWRNPPRATPDAHPSRFVHAAAPLHQRTALARTNTLLRLPWMKTTANAPGVMTGNISLPTLPMKSCKARPCFGSNCIPTGRPPTTPVPRLESGRLFFPVCIQSVQKVRGVGDRQMHVLCSTLVQFAEAVAVHDVQERVRFIQRSASRNNSVAENDLGGRPLAERLFHLRRTDARHNVSRALQAFSSCLS